MLNCSNIQSLLVNHYAKVEWLVSRLADTIHLAVPLFSVFNVEEEISKNRINPCDWLAFLNTQLDHCKSEKIISHLFEVVQK